MLSSYMCRCTWVDERNGIVEINYTDTVSQRVFLIVWVNVLSNDVEIKEYQGKSVSENVERIREQSLERAKKFAEPTRPLYPEKIRWHEDGMKFETLHESWEWADVVVYHEIGNMYDGYRTEDVKIAMALVYELTSQNTYNRSPFEVRANTKYLSLDKSIHRVWIERLDNE